MASIPQSLDAEDVRKMIRSNIEKMGITQKEYAMIEGVSPAYLCDVLAGRRDPGGKLLKAHGMKKVIYYEWIKE
jgi:predicted transcriptional regulator